MPLMRKKVCESKARKGGGKSSTATTLDNNESKSRDGQLGFVEWYNLFGP